MQRAGGDAQGVRKPVGLDLVLGPVDELRGFLEVGQGLVELSELVQRARELGATPLPGCVTPSDLMRAWQLGLDVVKFFPADIAGGPAAISALSAPYRMMRFVPTGGVNAANVAEYLRLPQVLACGGSWLAAKSLYASGDYSAVERVAREAVEKTRAAQST